MLRELEYADEQLEVAQVGANKTHDDAKTPKEEASKHETDYVVKMGRRNDDDGWGNKQLLGKVASDFSWSKELVVVHAELE